MAWLNLRGLARTLVVRLAGIVAFTLIFAMTWVPAGTKGWNPVWLITTADTAPKTSAGSGGVGCGV